MAGKTKIVDDLVSDVRSLLDESNNEQIDTNADILPALNRGQDFAANILARHYDSPLLRKRTVILSGTTNQISIREDAFEQRVEKVEVKIGERYTPVDRVDFRDASLYESEQAVSVPSKYYISENSIFLLPKSNGTYNLRVWELVDPLPLVIAQGRITSVVAASNYILVDAIGSSLTTSADSLDCYVNIIDGQTGIRKASMQIQSLDTANNKIIFKSTPTRTTVLGQTVSDDLADLQDINSEDIDIEADDYICLIKGTCIPTLKKPYSNFIIQYAVAELTRKLGGAADMEERVKKDLEQQVERSWVGREATLRVARKNRNWQTPLRYRVR